MIVWRVMVIDGLHYCGVGIILIIAHMENRVKAIVFIGSLEELTGMEVVKLAGDNVAYADVDGFYDHGDDLIIELCKREFFGVTAELLLIDDVLIVIRIQGHKLILVSGRGAQYFLIISPGSLLQQQCIKKGLSIHKLLEETLGHL